MTKIEKLLLVLIISLALFVRVFKISSIPPSLSWDEASIGYDAYSILKTGKDQWGNFMPVAFRSFGEYKYPMHIYGSIPFVYLFGLSEAAVRLPSAFMGVFVIGLFFFLTKKLTGNMRISLIASFLMTISQWHIQFSRVAWETNFFLALLFSAIILFLLYIKNSRPKDVLLSSILFGLSMFSYNAAKIVTPIVIFSLAIVYFKNIKSQIKTLAIASLIIFVFFIINITDPNLSGLSRLNQLKFSESEVTKTWAYKNSKNYRLGVINYAAKEYLSYYSYRFLFISGDANPRHSIQSIGEFYFPYIIFMPIGLFVLLHKRNKESLIIFTLLLISPIPGAIAREAPHASRAILMAATWAMIASIGIDIFIKIFNKKYRKYVSFLVVFLFVVLFANYFKNYLITYPTGYSKEWQYGYKQVFDYIKNYGSSYDNIYITRSYGEPQIFALFYLQYPPEKYQNDKNLIRYHQGDWERVDQFDKFAFVDTNEDGFDFDNRSNNLYIGTINDVPKNANILKTISYLNNEPAFVIFDFL